VLQVDRTRDGRSFTTRRVEASQNGEPIFTMVASFHVEEGDPEDDWQLPAPEGIPPPDTLDRRPSVMSTWAPISPFDVRMVRQPNEGDWPLLHPFWIRLRATLPDDPGLHACVLTFFSDMAVVGSALAPGRTRVSRMGASLDHAVWFHRSARADEWVLFSVDPVSNAGSRGLARGTMHTEAGVLIASIAQEALLRRA
jgi:acyl-CoA thioesterase-2